MDVHVTNAVVTWAREVPTTQVKAEAEQEAWSVSGGHTCDQQSPDEGAAVALAHPPHRSGRAGDRLGSGWACGTQVAPSLPFACPSNVGIGSTGLLYARQALLPDHVPLFWSKAVTVGRYDSHSSMH